MILSICMMVKNEEMHLERCLRSLQSLIQGVGAELIIVDTGSIDNTVEIAKKYTERVYFREWNNDFASMRNITIDYAKGKWVLIIDADEEIRETAKLINFFRHPQINEFNVGSFTLQNIIDDDGTYGSMATIMRLFRNENFKYEGAVHEIPKIKGKVALLNIVIYHYGYIQSNKDMVKKKHERYRELLKSEVEKNPDNVGYRYYLSMEYAINKEIEKALHEAQKAYELLIEQKKDLRKYIFVFSQLAICLFDNQKEKESEQICLEGLAITEHQLDLHYCLGYIYYIRNNYDNAIKHFERYLELINNFDDNELRYTGTCQFVTMNKFNDIHFELMKCYIQKIENDKPDDKEYLQLFNNYLTKGFLYIKNKYEGQIINNELIVKAENEEEIFLINMYLAVGKLTANENNFTEYVRSALNIFPAMSKGVNLLLEEYKSSLNNGRNSEVNNEFEEYKKQIKQTLEQLIDSNQLDSAMQIISEYESIISDPEIIKIKDKLQERIRITSYL